jgi:hypothetical protein
MRAPSGIGIKWNQGSNQRKLKVWWSSRGLIEQIRDQGSTCKRCSKLELTNESGRDAIAWN